MAKLDKGTLALTFKFDCDRFLRFRLASKFERDQLGISDKKDRPGIQLMTTAGRRWEADKYQDLIDTSDKGKILYKISNDIDNDLGRKPFEKIDNLFEILKQSTPPEAIIEAQFAVPESISSGLKKACHEFDLEQANARPDILWIRPYGTGAPLLGNNISPEFEIHIIDVKMAAEPSLRHFTEVTYYALALKAAIDEHEDLRRRYAVSAEGTIWPGSHDMNQFRNLVKENRAKDILNPVSAALNSTLIRVPYEVYEIHVKQFFEERLLNVLAKNIEDTGWHVSHKCQLCDYVRYCKDKASECDHLSRLAWLNYGQAELMRTNGISTTAELNDAISNNDDRWQRVVQSSHQLRADGAALAARAQSLQSGMPLLIDGRRCAIMPAWTDQSIFITIHFDPGSGISFALGAARLYFPHGRKKGDPPLTEEKIFIVDRVDAMNPATERERLKEFAILVSEWLQEVSIVNDSLPSNEKLSSHIFFWDILEIRQLKRMFERHMQYPDVIELLDVLTRFFPPDNLMPDLDTFKSQPGTVVKEVLKMLVGLPLAHDYTLFETANNFYPNKKDDGTLYKFELPFGFVTPMSDQIPFERAYELWQDKPYIKHFNKHYPTDISKWRKYSRDDVYNGIKSATQMHLRALQHIVRRLRENYKDKLILKKNGFTSARTTQALIPEKARNLVAFEKLNIACQEIENKNIRSLPVEEREARFFSIRGLWLMSEIDRKAIFEKIKDEPQPSELYVFSFSVNSRDSRIKEGDFLTVLSNEEQHSSDVRWMHILKLNIESAKAHLEERDIYKSKYDEWKIYCTVSKLLQVEIVKLEAMQEIPYLVVRPNDSDLFRFAIDSGFIDLSKPMVIDPLFADFSSARIEKALRTVGGKPAAVKRTKKRR